MIRKESESFRASNIVTDIVYNRDGTMLKESAPYFKNAGPIYWTLYEYDALKRLSKSTEPGNRTTTFLYNGLSRTTINPENQKNVKVQSPQGKLLKSIDNNNSVLSFDYDSDLSLVATTDPKNNSIISSYDAHGNKTYMKDPDMGEFKYEYNTLNLLVKETKP